jgi:hypothetical protein
MRRTGEQTEDCGGWVAGFGFDAARHFDFSFNGLKLLFMARLHPWKHEGLM